MGEVDEEIANDYKEDGDENESTPIVEEEVANREEKEAEIVLLDYVTTDDQGTPTDERSTRRHSHWDKKLEDEALASRAMKLRLSDMEETGGDIPQAKETSTAEKDVSPKALEMRYEAERKRKGKQEAKPQKKKPRQVSRAVVISETTPEAI